MKRKYKHTNKFLMKQNIKRLQDRWLDNADLYLQYKPEKKWWEFWK